MNEWSIQDEQYLTRRAAEGASYGMIAREMQKTRNAVIGKSKRLHLPSRRQLSGKPAMPKKKRARSTIHGRKNGHDGGLASRLSHFIRFGHEDKPVRLRPRPAPIPEPPSLHLTLLDLTDKTCKWPEGDGPFLFCGHATSRGTPYCEHHFHRAFIPTSHRNMENFDADKRFVGRMTIAEKIDGELEQIK